MNLKEKIAHFHLIDSMGNKKSLVCWLTDMDTIRYVFFGGHGDGGTPFSLSNLQVTLPIEPKENETKVQFKIRLKRLINDESVCRVVHEVNPVKFK